MLFAYIAVFIGTVAATLAIVVGGLGGVIVGTAFLMGAASTYYQARSYAALRSHAETSADILAALLEHPHRLEESHEAPRSRVGPLDDLVTR